MVSENRDFRPQERRLSRREFDRIVAAGVFREDERIELVHGVLAGMSPVGEIHAEVVTTMTEAFVLALRGRARVRPQCPFAVGDDSEPQPDIAVVTTERHTEEHPSRAYLLVEIAESSLAYDRTIKSTLYSSAGIAEYWIVNLVDQCIEVHREPRASGGYAQVITRRRGESVTLLAFPDVTLAVDDVLPRAR